MIWKFIRIIDINLCWTSAKMEMEKDFLHKSTLLVKCQLLFLIRVKISCDSTCLRTHLWFWRGYTAGQSSDQVSQIWATADSREHEQNLCHSNIFPNQMFFPIKCFQCENCFQISDKIFLLSPVYLTATSIVQMLPKYKKDTFLLVFFFWETAPSFTLVLFDKIQLSVYDDWIVFVFFFSGP